MLLIMIFLPPKSTRFCLKHFFFNILPSKDFQLFEIFLFFFGRLARAALLGYMISVEGDWLKRLLKNFPFASLEFLVGGIFLKLSFKHELKHFTQSPACSPLETSSFVSRMCSDVAESRVPTA